MGDSDYDLSNSRGGNDGASSISWLAACDINLADYVKTNKAIIAFLLTSTAHTPNPESFKIQWRNTDGGTFADLITGSGELRAGVSAGCITNTDPVGSGSGCGGTIDASEELENESPLQSASLAASQNDYIELQACVDFSNALDGNIYEFQVYSVSASAVCDGTSVTVTTDGLATLSELEIIDDYISELSIIDDYISEIIVDQG